MKRFFRQLLIDIAVAVFVFVVSLFLAGSFNSAGFSKYGGYGLFYYGVHLFTSLAYRKYEVEYTYTSRELVARYFECWMYSTGTVLLLIYVLQLSFLSRQVVLSNVFGLLLLEFLFMITLMALRGSANATLDKKEDDRHLRIAIINRKNISSIDNESVLDLADELIEELGDDKARLLYISGIVDKEPGKALLLKTSNIVNILNQPINTWQKIVNLQRLNLVRYVNKFLNAINSRLPVNGLIAICAETKNQRKERILNKFPPLLNYIYYTFDYLFKRVLPKIPVGKKIYFALTKGRNRVMDRSEILGRVFSCGFQVITEQKINNLLVVIARKKSESTPDIKATYGPFIYLNRVGKGGKIIKVYKFRTMHPYSEYLQEYVYKNNSLSAGGKIKDDYRICSVGRFMRKYWLDELPMLINFLKGELKIVGVRPLSEHYFNLYSPELKQLRIKTKPGLIPPFYADMPQTLEEIEASELCYLEAWQRAPFRTDMKYFFLAFRNIVFRRARSH